MLYELLFTYFHYASSSINLFVEHVNLTTIKQLRREKCSVKM